MRFSQFAIYPCKRVISSREDSPSGLWRSLGKRVGCKPSGVQIPYPPLVKKVSRWDTFFISSGGHTIWEESTSSRSDGTERRFPYPAPTTPILRLPTTDHKHAAPKQPHRQGCGIARCNQGRIQQQSRWGYQNRCTSHQPEL